MAMAKKPNSIEEQLALYIDYYVKAKGCHPDVIRVSAKQYAKLPESIASTGKYQGIPVIVYEAP